MQFIMIMTRKILIALFVVAVLLCSEVILAGRSEDDSGLHLRLKNLPVKAPGDKVFIKVIKVEDGSVVSVLKEAAQEEINVNIPPTHVLLTGTFLPLSLKNFYQGAVGAYPGKDPLMTMANAPAQAASAAGSLPTYLPENGMAIGYNRDHFTASGPGTEPWFGRALEELVITDLGAYQCTGGGDNTYVVVGSEDPSTSALLRAEIDLQKSPAFDPDYVVTPHWVRATHLVKGNLVLTPNTITANLRLEDMAGRVIATSSHTGPLESFFDTIERAAIGISEQACGKGAGRGWRGNVTVTTTKHVEGKNPSGDPFTESGTGKLVCELTGREDQASCSYSSEYELKGKDASTETKQHVSDYRTHVGVSVADGKLMLSFSVIPVTVDSKIRIAGQSFSDTSSGTLTNSSYVLPASANSAASQSGTWTDPNPILEKLGSKIVVTWSLFRQ
jgi:hypothetical protein